MNFFKSLPKRPVERYWPIVLLLALLAGVNSCKSDDDEVIVDPEPEEVFTNAASLDGFFAENREKAVQRFTIDPSAGQSIVGEKGTRIEFPEYTFLTLSGDTVRDEVTFELVEIFERKDMILLNKPTNGIQQDGTEGILTSAGEFFFDAHVADQRVKLGRQVIVYAPKFKEPSQTVELFIGGADLASDEAWLGLQLGVGTGSVDPVTNVESFPMILGPQPMPPQTDTSLAILREPHFLGGLGWRNLDYFIDDPRPKTEVKVSLPDGLSGENTKVFFSIDGIEDALFLLKPNESNLTFVSNRTIPIGERVHFIAMTEVDDQITYSKIPATITEGHELAMRGFVSVSEEEFVAILEALP